jgi:hypothetical protein
MWLKVGISLSIVAEVLRFISVSTKSVKAICVTIEYPFITSYTVEFVILKIKIT